MLAFQLFCRLWPLPRLMVTTQLLVPLTEHVTLTRSVPDSPVLTSTRRAAPPPPPPHPAPLPGAPPPRQEALGRLLLPLRQTVMPKLLPLPFGVAVRVP